MEDAVAVSALSERDPFDAAAPIDSAPSHAGLHCDGCASPLAQSVALDNRRLSAQRQRRRVDNIIRRFHTRWQKRRRALDEPGGRTVAMGETPVIRHIVLVRFQASASAAQIAAAMQGVVDLQGEVPGIVAASCGADVSPEVMSQGFSHAIVLDFVDAAARDVYLTHPAHMRAGRPLLAITEGGMKGLIVVDYVV